MAGAPGPESDRRRFRSELRSLRLKSGQSVIEVATRLGWPPARITQIEQGETPLSQGELVELLEAYGIRNPEHVEALLTLARAASERIWWDGNKYLPDPYVELISAEADAARITHFHPIFVPGLLQTSAYATAITVATTLKDAPAAMIAALVDARMRRQDDLLGDTQSVKICALIDENALYRRVGSEAAMRQQLDHLAAFVNHDQVTLAIIPRSVESHPGLLGAFMVLEYDDQDNEPVVCFDGQLGNVVVRSQPELAEAYLKLSRQLLRMGLTGDSARASIQAAHGT
jgi:transcriptional regulator with XRE-family HTH domain